LLRLLARGAPRAPRHDREGIEQAARRRDGDEAEQQRPARLEIDLVMDVLDGLEADQRQQQEEREHCGDAGVLRGGGDIDVRVSGTSAPFPKFVIHCSNLRHELRKQEGH